ncbi:hypothetical protein, conserved [Leishmania tarentolae]|uniref:Uncharacterized protein n=1 Tax=Leishmania tarentolae TaxID=5689 RepID=A0A640KQ78_LEITA|nr:hypothetical protein, conserved [Leishmania tarentolae]
MTLPFMAFLFWGSGSLGSLLYFSHSSLVSFSSPSAVRTAPTLLPFILIGAIVLVHLLESCCRPPRHLLLAPFPAPTIPSSPMTTQAAREARKRTAAATVLAPASPSPPFDFHTVTCITWSASGRNIGVGTTDGFLIYSTEPLFSNLSGSSTSQSTLAHSTEAAGLLGTDVHHSMVQEVCRCAVYGGVGLLSLYKQCSLVAFTGVQRRSAAARIQLADISLQAPPDFYAPSVPPTSAEVAGAAQPSPRCKPWSPEEDAAVAHWYERWRVSVFANSSAATATTVSTLAFVECPSTVVGLNFCPHAVFAATSGDPKIIGSHTLHVFDHHLNPLYTLPVYPPSSNAYLKDMIAIAASPTLSNGAGMAVQRLRVLLPGERKGEVRLLTFKKSMLTASSFEDATHNGCAHSLGSPHPQDYGDTHRLVDKVLHQAPVRAVAITEDGKSGVTMSEQGMRIRVLDFVGDDKITNRLTLDRGHLPAVVDTVSLAIVAVPQTHPLMRNAAAVTACAHGRCGSNDNSAPAHVSEALSRQFQRLTEAVHNIVVCLTSSGTAHIFGCGLQQVLFYHSDKTLSPRAGYPYAFSVCLSPLLAKDGVASVFVVRSDVTTSAVHYLPHHEHSNTKGVKSTCSNGMTDHLPCEFFAFELRYHSSAAAAMASGEAGSTPKCTTLFCCTLSAP